MRRVEVNPGEIFMVADRMILVEEYESILGFTGKLGTTDNDRLAYMFTFTGRINNSKEKDSVTVAMSPEDASELLDDILHGLELLVKARDENQQ